MEYALYSPDGWEAFENDGKLYIFGSWSGGYTSGDYWRRNSGVVAVQEDTDHFYFFGKSGSLYKCLKNAHRLGGYNGSVLGEIYRINPNAKKVDYDWIRNNFDVTEFIGS